MLQRRSQFCLHIGTVSLTLAAFVITVIHNGLPQRTLFHYSSNSKESASNAEDPGSIPGLGRSPGEVNGNPL